MILTEEQYRRSLLPHLEELDGCLIWTGFVHPRGYGVVLQQRAHKAYWEYHNGLVPEGLELAHSCNNKLCVRHVRPKTHLDNLQEYSGKTLLEQCGRGHDMTEDNVYWEPGKNRRKCRKCNKFLNRKAYWKKKGFSDAEAEDRALEGVE